VTEDIATAGERAAEETARLERAKLLGAENALCHALRTRDPAIPLLKREAENFLCAQGLRQKVARILLTQGGNHDLYPAGRWVLRPIPHAKGNAIGVYLAGEEDHNPNNTSSKSPSNDTPNAGSVSVDGSTPCNQNTASLFPAKNKDETEVIFRLPHEYTTTETDTALHKDSSGLCEGGIISVDYAPSSDSLYPLSGEMSLEPCIHEHTTNDGRYCFDCDCDLPL
jgi:hypothetical protein